MENPVQALSQTAADISKSRTKTIDERLKSPIFSSYVISLLVWNYDVILNAISASSAKDKIDIISKTHANCSVFFAVYLVPVAFSVLYIFLLPIIDAFASDLVAVIENWKERKILERRKRQPVPLDTQLEYFKRWSDVNEKLRGDIASIRKSYSELNNEIESKCPRLLERFKNHILAQISLSTGVPNAIIEGIMMQLGNGQSAFSPESYKLKNTIHFQILCKFSSALTDQMIERIADSKFDDLQFRNIANNLIDNERECLIDMLICFNWIYMDKFSLDKLSYANVFVIKALKSFCESVTNTDIERVV